MTATLTPLPTHRESSNRLARQWFAWAMAQGLQPEMRAIPATKRRGPRWRIGTTARDGERSWAEFDDRQAGLVFRGFAAGESDADPTIDPIVWEDEG